MLPKKYRLDRETFDHVYKNGKSFSGEHFHAKVFSLKAENKENHSRISVVIPKKVAADAVERNRLRRQGYRAVEEDYGILPQGLGVIIFLTSSSKNLSFPDLQKEIADFFKSIKV